MGKKRGRPPKPESERLAERLEVRASESDRADFERAAELSALSLSDWIRDRLKACAKRELRRADQ